MPAPAQVPDDEKLRELILLVAQASANDIPFGAIKLNKLLFYIDFEAFIKFGSAVTGHEYQRLPNGPAPKQLLPIRHSMESRKECVQVPVDYFGKTMHRTVALRAPNLAKFTAQEVDLAHSVVRRFWGMDAKQMSEKSHQFIGWKLADDKEAIPYNVALVERGHRSSVAEQICESLAAKAQECLSRAETAE